MPAAFAFSEQVQRVILADVRSVGGSFGDLTRRVVQLLQGGAVSLCLRPRQRDLVIAVFQNDLLTADVLLAAV